jgi:hypothetical protein
MHILSLQNKQAEGDLPDGRKEQPFTAVFMLSGRKRLFQM